VSDSAIAKHLGVYHATIGDWPKKTARLVESTSRASTKAQMTADAKPCLPGNAVRWIQDQRGLIRHAALWTTTALRWRPNGLPSLAISVPGELCQDFVHLIVDELLALNPVRAARQRVRKLIAQLQHVRLRVQHQSSPRCLRLICTDQ